MSILALILAFSVTMGFLPLTYAQGLPSFMLDHTGFKLPDGDPMANAANKPSRLYPAFPLIKKRGSRQGQAIGYVIPAEHLQARRAKNLYRSAKPKDSNVIHFSMGMPQSPQVKEAIEQMQRAGLYAYNISGNVYGLREQVDYIRIGRKSSLGINLFPDFSSNKTLDLMDYSQDYSFSPLSTVVDLFDDLDHLVNGASTQQRIEQSLRESTVLGSYVYHNAVNGFDQWIPVLDPALAHLKQGIPAARRTEVRIPEDRQSIGTHTHASERSVQDEFSQEVNKLMEKIKRPKTLKKEQEWQAVVSFAADTTIILADPIANVLVQTLCDVIAEVLEVPLEIWPKCRVAATLVPNAWAFPGGDIFISAGMIGITPSVDSIAYILAHEIGHVVARHGSKKMPIAQAYQFGFRGLSYYLNYVLMNNLIGGMGNVNWLNLYPKTMLASVKSVAYSVPVGYAVGHLVRTSLIPFMAYGRSMESQSDRIGQQAALSLGLDNRKFVEGWESMRSYSNKYFNDGSNPGFWDRVLSSHPAVENRIENLQEDKTEHMERFAGKELGQFASLMLDDYRNLHEMLKPFSTAYGEFMHYKINKNKNNQLVESEALLVNNFMQSLYSGTFGCWLH